MNTEAFYRASCEAGYVKVADIARNIAWTTPTEWGDLQITVNLSKPEKDPRAIAEAAKQDSSGNPDYVDPATGRIRPCPLCVTREDVECGYAERLELGGDPWALWYSPYAYYEEHCIAMSWEHRPMHVDRAAFESLFDAVDALPRYFFGSNADLPIVGGSILAHDHFQGGRHTFPMEMAALSETFDLSAFPGVRAGIVRWPLSVIRLTSRSRSQLVDAATCILRTWVTYDDLEVGIVSGFGDAVDHVKPLGGDGGMEQGDGSPAAPSSPTAGGAMESGSEADSHATLPGRIEKRHNTITPIVRKKGRAYEMDLALRCNIASEEHPLGVFHPHSELHHVKKENIGLIEVMGLAILPPRLQQVMEDRGMTRDDVGRTFAMALEHAGVFKWDNAGREALHRFIRLVESRGAAV